MDLFDDLEMKSMINDLLIGKERYKQVKLADNERNIRNIVVIAAIDASGNTRCLNDIV